MLEDKWNLPWLAMQCRSSCSRYVLVSHMYTQRRFIQKIMSSCHNVSRAANALNPKTLQENIVGVEREPADNVVPEGQVGEIHLSCHSHANTCSHYNRKMLVSLTSICIYINAE